MCRMIIMLELDSNGASMESYLFVIHFLKNLQKFLFTLSFLQSRINNVVSPIILYQTFTFHEYYIYQSRCVNSPIMDIVYLTVPDS